MGSEVVTLLPKWRHLDVKIKTLKLYLAAQLLAQTDSALLAPALVLLVHPQLMTSPPAPTPSAAPRQPWFLKVAPPGPPLSAYPATARLHAPRTWKSPLEAS